MIKHRKRIKVEQQRSANSNDKDNKNKGELFLNNLNEGIWANLIDKIQLP